MLTSYINYYIYKLKAVYIITLSYKLFIFYSLVFLLGPWILLNSFGHYYIRVSNEIN